MVDIIETKRLFFGMPAHAPWPNRLPRGRILEAKDRHITLAFLGDTEYERLENALLHFPLPFSTVGSVGTFDQCLFLPPKHPRVVAWRVAWLEKTPLLDIYQKQLNEWLKERDFPSDQKHAFSPHVTLARSPLELPMWKDDFRPLPCFFNEIVLYESRGSSKYDIKWSYPLLAPFEEVEHTADIAYRIRGENFDVLFRNAQIALSFTFPPLLQYLRREEFCFTIEEVIEKLNHIVFEADRDIGTPFKAVSFHTELEQIGNVMHWEMIVDV